MAAGYSLADVAKLLGLPAARVRSFVTSGLVSAEKDETGAYRFGFQDLVILRAAKELLDAEIPATRIKRALLTLREQLPTGRPLSAVQITSQDGRIVVRDGKGAWQPESGQSLLDFGTQSLARKAAPFLKRAHKAAQANEDTLSADDWFELGAELEISRPSEARDAYRRAIELLPDHADAHVNLGRLLHEAGEFPAALAHYRLALDSRPEDATARFNMAVALEDMGQLRGALTAYEEVVVALPEHADAHYNLAGLCERLGQNKKALRHLAAYKRLMESR